ncbi:MAG: uroporphyrinogen-III C-methyltransferase [Fusobacteriaceae bacterium]
MHKGKVYLIGAGCGNIDLLTLKAKRVIENSDCIIYDRLIDPKVLKLAKSNAELIYLGKGNTEGGTIQSEINKTLVEKALEGKIVARVKGGDSFVFGRGGEELEAINEHNIPFEIIPGISSSIAVPEYAGIPVTHRGIARSFHVFTGHTVENGEWHDFETIAQLEGTLIFLMGIKNLTLITEDLIKFGKSKSTPVGIIEKGATTDQKVTVGTLENIVSLSKDIVPPAIIVIGEVVNFRKEFKWFENLPLFGKRILITRDKNQNNEITEKLRIEGAEVQELPLLSIDASENTVDKEELKKYSALLFNSSNGVKFFMEKIKDLRDIGHMKIGVVGKKTEEILLTYKIVPDFVPEEYTVNRLAEEVVKFTEPKDKILVVTSDISPCEENIWKEKYGREFQKFVAYHTQKTDVKKEDVEEILKKVDYLTFFSSSTVESFYKGIEENISLIKDKKIVSIGPVTSETLRSFGIKVDIEAEIYDTDGVISAIRGEKNV